MADVKRNGRPDGRHRGIETVFSTRRQIWRAEPPSLQEALHAFEFDPADLFHYLKNVGGMKTTLPCELARTIAERQGARRICWQILAALAELENSRGRGAEAEKLHHQAREIVTTIADHTGSERMQTSFLTQPAVARLLNEP